MTVLTMNYDLIPSLPIQLAPDHPFVDLYTLVPELLDLHPIWTEADVREFLEEKTRKQMTPEDYQTLLAVYGRVVRLRSEFP